MGEDGGKSQVGLHEQCVSRELTINSNGKQAERSGMGWERRQAGVFYRACMDTASIELLGASPLKPYLNAIDAIQTHDDLIDVIAMMQVAFSSNLLL